MYNSIAPVELTSQMQRQFAPTERLPGVDRQPAAQASVRHRVSAMLHALANALEPAPTTRQGA